MLDGLLEKLIMQNAAMRFGIIVAVITIIYLLLELIIIMVRVWSGEKLISALMYFGKYRVYRDPDASSPAITPYDHGEPEARDARIEPTLDETMPVVPSKDQIISDMYAMHAGVIAIVLEMRGEYLAAGSVDCANAVSSLAAKLQSMPVQDVWQVGFSWMTENRK